MNAEQRAKGECVLMIFAKAPIAGQVKTRLGCSLGMRKAANIYQQMLYALLEKLSQLTDIKIQLWCSPDTRHPFFRRCAREFDIELKRQLGYDLGQRMSHAFRVNRSNHYGVLIGADIPGIDNAVIVETLGMMHRGADIVLLPTEDGGYGLIAMSQPHPHLFTHMCWSTSMVLQQTLARIKHRRLKYRLLDRLADIDTKSDYIKHIRR